MTAYYQQTWLKHRVPNFLELADWSGGLVINALKSLTII